jgi:uncharacterized BrkB/YihY/UPF0761 family membrane protein
MPIKVTCSNCGGVLHAPDDAGGKKGRCPTCGNVLPIPTEAPRVASGPIIPDAPPKPSARSQSFGEFSPGHMGSDHASPAKASTPTVPDTRRASVPLPPPNATPAKNRVGFGPPPEELAKGAKGWRRVGRGLWWTRIGIFLLLLPFVLVNGRIVYETLAKPLPFKEPGYLGVPWLNSTQEIELASVAVPLILGLPLLLLGRLGVSGAPAKARTSGLASFAAFATLLAVLGGVMFLMPVVAMIATEDAGRAPAIIEKVQNQPPRWQLFGIRDTEGLMQRGGMVLGFLGLALAEFWFLASVGRIGTALDSPRLAGRATRMTVLYGLVVAAVFVVAVGSLRQPSFAPENPNAFTQLSHDVTRYVEEQWNSHLQPQYDKLGSNKPAARAGLGVLAALVAGLGYFRMIGAGRTAVRNWLETHDRP